MAKFKVANINCENCANTIKRSLEDEFGKIDVDLSVEPRVVSLDIEDKDIERFKSELDEIGFKVIEQI
ncbi:MULTISPECIES: heavy-metal-associated domain-containing protein [unclassified Campylobacter]|uniref:heavy-metal-associated domain-containing protein n=1 Tax=unclassified Campylobacter TaxID=2593542 RepID=UPI00147615DE|nr:MULTISPECIES: heavy-metal-associated domain-containing protein [unclassified Campylobacter]